MVRNKELIRKSGQRHDISQKKKCKWAIILKKLFIIREMQNEAIMMTFVTQHWLKKKVRTGKQEEKHKVSLIPGGRLPFWK